MLNFDKFGEGLRNLGVALVAAAFIAAVLNPVTSAVTLVDLAFTFIMGVVFLILGSLDV